MGIWKLIVEMLAVEDTKLGISGDPLQIWGGLRRFPLHCLQPLLIRLILIQCSVRISFSCPLTAPTRLTHLRLEKCLELYTSWLEDG